MNSATWCADPVLALAAHATGSDVRADQLSSVVLVQLGRDRPRPQCYLLAPGAQPPPSIAASGRAAAAARPNAQLHAVTGALALALHDRTPVIGMDMPAVLTMLHTQCQRQDVPTLYERLGRADLVRPVIDIAVLHRTFERFRAGPHNLADLCAYFGVPRYGEDDLAYDAWSTAMVAHVIATRYPAARSMSADALHDAQVVWARDRDNDRRKAAASRTTRGYPAEPVDCGWPVLDLCSEAKQGELAMVGAGTGGVR